MKIFEVVFKSLEDLNSFGNRRFNNINLLKTSGKRAVFLEDATEFLIRCGTNTLQLTGCQHWLNKVGCIHDTTGSSTCTNNSVDLIYKEYRTLFLLQLTENSLKTFLKITAILGTSNQGAEIK